MTIESVGISGTQEGWTKEQEYIFPTVLETISGMKEFHHGDCVGVDDQAGRLVYYAGGTRVITHPPIKENKRAFSPSHETRPAKDYLVRNADIVSESDILIVVPKEDEEVIRSGTWSTYRLAKARKKPIVLIYPDGEVITIE